MFQDHQKILFVQIRDDDMRDHERMVVREHSFLKEDQVKYFDAFIHEFNGDELDSVDALFIGGSGDYLISQGHAPRQIEKVVALVKMARERGLPTLGMCFGGQIMTHAFGGKLVLDESRTEMGTYRLKKKPAAEHCPIFSGLPDEFDAQLGHQDHMEVLPEGAVNLLSSELSQVQAWTFPGEPLYALTFHPELDPEGVEHRLRYYASKYGFSQEQINDMLSEFTPAPHAKSVLRLFLDKVVGKGECYQSNVDQITQIRTKPEVSRLKTNSSNGPDSIPV